MHSFQTGLYVVSWDQLALQLIYEDEQLLDVTCIQHACPSKKIFTLLLVELSSSEFEDSKSPSMSKLFTLNAFDFLIVIFQNDVTKSQTEILSNFLERS